MTFGDIVGVAGDFFGHPQYKKGIAVGIPAVTTDFEAEVS